ncbi:cytochrome c [Aestuariicoccus sp. MJ-SS9]|uniref:c-type cytochrome n=1 Tax=Aestuariicoccus sp. MJ-SS9 TaxID=3079855 RepID=UPI00290E221D|nr:cytochrome c [Aestuariicoccus sp. MJ-SS9]MDU8912008.1 cytochrome c [Aestuariicoccus sp. MJ-SS9]
MSVRLKFAPAIAAGVMALAAAQGASAQDFTYGEQMFRQNCAVCHGDNAEGDGPVAELFAQKPANLRELSKGNGGAFPFSEVYQSIDGRRQVKAHGVSEMPVWGDLLMEEAYPATIHPGVTAEDIVQGRVLALVYYLQSIQH